MKSMKIVGLALGASLALSTAALAQDITIAVAGPMTGGESAFGRQMKNGADQAVADRAGFPSPGKPADAAYAAGPPTVLVIDDGGSQVKPFLLPAGMQETVAVFSPGKARFRAL